MFFFFFKQKTAYEMRISDWSSDVCSSDLMTFDFGTLIAHLARTRTLGAGSIIGSGTVSNRDADGSPGKPIEQGGRGYSCIAEVRMVETIISGAPYTPFLGRGCTLRIRVQNDQGQPVFGTIARVGGN